MPPHLPDTTDFTPADQRRELAAVLVFCLS